jgi:hypothetical protein
MATNFANDTAGNKYECTTPRFNHKAKLYTAEELADKPKLVDELVALGFGGLKLVEATTAAKPKVVKPEPKKSQQPKKGAAKPATEEVTEPANEQVTEPATEDNQEPVTEE